MEIVTGYGRTNAWMMARHISWPKAKVLREASEVTGWADVGGGLTTPHKLQAEACSRKRVQRQRVVFAVSKPMAEACQLHAVVRRHVPRGLGRRSCMSPVRSELRSRVPTATCLGGGQLVGTRLLRVVTDTWRMVSVRGAGIDAPKAQ